VEIDPMYRIGFGCALLLAGVVSAHAEASDYRFDSVHTQIIFFADHLGFSHPSGRLHVQNGYFHFDPDDWSTAKVDVRISIATLDMGDAAWEKKLKSDEFFNLKRFPEAHFLGSRVEKTGDNSGVIHGELTLHGVTRKLDLPIVSNKVGRHSFSLQYVAGFSATLSFKRSDFGMRASLPAVGDEVQIRLEVEGVRDEKAQEKSSQAPKANAEESSDEPEKH
jgi:polyisoprenoid-binding protein YceI